MSVAQSLAPNGVLKESFGPVIFGNSEVIRLSLRIARQNEAACAADAGACIGATVSALERRTATAYHPRGDTRGAVH